MTKACRPRFKATDALPVTYLGHAECDDFSAYSLKGKGAYVPGLSVPLGVRYCDFATDTRMDCEIGYIHKLRSDFIHERCVNCGRDLRGVCLVEAVNHYLAHGWIKLRVATEDYAQGGQMHRRTVVVLGKAFEETRQLRYGGEAATP